ncbi:adenylate/guanylate cyclase domain-containing protein [Methylobacterium sp. SyP6R]|uniref:adenylate/guanylate cyclase domain-containing protein n=1 Tax=Methylobacterium sp. SyP6R TaxID=2718876 RepID=UPI001F221C28|nr:adenylate/guanylate cyclase domain-containing protein [Methylobacterium sp. SyP6R]MCF4124924.1 adenylate/guanylate cyclase domain-containing protein [Methylobacterium sp. SyP6R]
MSEPIAAAEPPPLSQPKASGFARTSLARMLAFRTSLRVARLRHWLAGRLPPRARGRLAGNVRAAELAGLAFAFRARAVAIVVVSLWLLILVPWPRDLYYLAVAGLFFLLGYVPYRLRHHRWAGPIKLAFTVLDIALMTTAIIMPPPAGLGVDWPIQTRLRTPEFLYVLLLLGEAALTYWPVAVLWTGTWIVAIWSFGVWLVYGRADTVRFADTVHDGRLSAEAALRVFLDPAYVGLTPLWTQAIVTGLFTLLLAIAVWRGRGTMLAQVRAEVVRADLARYVSPDVADALAARAHAGFGAPQTRVVAVLFADVVGFTGMSEELEPERAFALLRGFRERSCKVVFRHAGTLDKFLGDGFMATFGGLDGRGDGAARAIACALDLQREIDAWTAKREARGAAPIRVAVGVHCGPVVIGNIGADQRVEFTVIGDVVNVASRLQAATREVGGRILASECCLAAAGPEAAGRFTRSLPLTLRGRTQPIVVHVAE